MEAVPPVDTAWECFDVSLADGVAHVQLNRPDAYNSMVLAFWTELPAIVRALDAAGTTRVMVLSSTGKHFMTYHRREITALCLQTGLPLTHSRNTCPTGLG